MSATELVHDAKPTETEIAAASATELMNPPSATELMRPSATEIVGSHVAGGHRDAGADDELPVAVPRNT